MKADGTFFILLPVYMEGSELGGGVDFARRRVANLEIILFGPRRRIISAIDIIALCYN